MSVPPEDPLRSYVRPGWHFINQWRGLRINARSLRGHPAWPWPRRWARALWHAADGPRHGCSCTYCFYSRRRHLPPGHPEHHIQREVQLRKEVQEALQGLADETGTALRRIISRG